MVTGASYNPMAPSTGRGTINKGAADASTGAIATTTQGVKGSFFALTDATSLVGRASFQVPASSLTVQNDPNAATKQYFTQQQMQQQYQMATAMTGLIGPAITSLGSALDGLFDGIGGGGGKKSNKEAIAKSEQGGCSGGSCNRGRAANNAWEDSCPNCQRNS